MRFRARKIDGKLDIQWDKLNLYVSRFKDNTFFDVEIKRVQKTVSGPMRAYYFSTVLPPFAEALGYDKDEHLLLHRQLKIVYFGIEPDKRGIYRKVPSVFGNKSKIAISDKQKFVEWVKRKAAIDGVYIPEPR